jgi:hypothetical protein
MLLMAFQSLISRRFAIKSSAFGALAVAIPNLCYSKELIALSNHQYPTQPINNRYPAIEESIVAEVVGLSHFDLDKLKVLVNQRPELARATWDWGFGDWETAIGAASHVCRKDIINFLISKGARPDIFTFAALGAFQAVKQMIEFYPGIQQISGPHGISLLQHAKSGLLAKTGNETEASNLIDYLEKLGNSDGKSYLVVEETDKQKYLGNYKYGDGSEDGFSIRLNMKKALSIGKIGKFGGALLKISDNKFTYNGAPSVEITFELENDKIISLTVREPNFSLKAKKVN